MYKNKIVGIVIILILCTSTVISTPFMYSPREKFKTENSSISTVANVITPEFQFQSQAQYLIEPVTNTVLYANNENEKLLPASVTKVMTY